MKMERPNSPPPPPARTGHTTSRALPPPPPPPRAQQNPLTNFARSAFEMGRTHGARPLPPPPPRTGAASTGVASASHSSVGTGLPAGISPAFARQVQQTPTAQLKQLSAHLKMEAVLARFSGNPAGAAAAQKKLSYVENQLHQREVKQDQVTRFHYQREVGGMSNEQLSGARSKESQSLFVAFLRGDAAGAKEASAKLGVIDAELGKREHALSDFAQSLGSMSPEQLDDLGGTLAEQFADVLFAPQSTGAQKDNVFNQLSLLLGEHLKRGLKTANTDWMYSK